MTCFYNRLVVLFLVQILVFSCGMSSSIESEYEKFITFYQNEKYEEADQVLSRLSQKYVGNRDVLMTNAIVRLNKGDYRKVVELLEGYQSSNDCDYQCRFYLAISYVSIGDSLKAQQVFENKKVEIFYTSSYDFTYKNYFPINVNSATEFEADFWYGMDSISRAYPLYVELKDNLYNLDRSYNRIGSILLRVNKFDEACEYFNNSCQLKNIYGCKNLTEYCNI